MQIPSVHVVGNLVWFHPEFMLKHLPYMSKMIDRKLIEQTRSFRQQYLTQRSGQDLARYVTLDSTSVPPTLRTSSLYYFEQSVQNK